MTFTLRVTSFQAHKQTLACVLDCMAHMLEIPEEVEAAFLRRTIKAFTWVKKKNSNRSYFIYSYIKILFAII